MRMPKHAKAALIRSLPLFAECTAREVTQVVAIADELILPAGRVLALEHAPGREFVVIVRGSARVQRGGTMIATLSDGDFFGEIALLTGRPRMASVVAETKVDALVIEGHAFMRLLEDAPGIRAKVKRALVERVTAAS
jgi:CRP/FNR family transcriptional regulator, cyclic AMP receptor protein